MKMKFYTLALMLCLAGSSFAQTVQPKLNIDVQRRTPVFDGDVDVEYTMTNTVTKSQARPQTSNNCGTEPAAGPTPNNSVSFGLLWDDDFLYLAVKVEDASIMEGDAIEVFFSPTNSSITIPDQCENIIYQSGPRPGYVLGDGQYFIMPEEFGGLSGIEGTIVNLSEAIWKPITGGYTVEAKLAFEDMVSKRDADGNQVAFKVCEFDNGHKMGFDLFNADDDAIGEDKQVAWNQCCSNRNWAETANFGEITLVGARVNKGNCVTSTNDMKNILSSVSLYPNPASSDKVDINLTALSSETVKVSVVNALSESLYSTEVKLVPGQNLVPVSVSDMTNGLYYIMVSNGKSVTSQKLVIAK